MTRPIKFRAWHKERKEMLTVVLLNQWKYSDGTDAGVCEGYGEDGLRKEFKLSDVILMQFTGLHDKNGKEIYEGDVLKVLGSSVAWGEKEKEVTKVVRFENGCFFTAKEFAHSENYRGYVETWGEVIGNLYENPELL